MHSLFKSVSRVTQSSRGVWHQPASLIVTHTRFFRLVNNRQSSLCTNVSRSLETTAQQATATPAHGFRVQPRATHFLTCAGRASEAYLSRLQRLLEQGRVSDHAVTTFINIRHV
jgi:hypothetical protein